MATTTNYGWATPDDTDLVKDGASAIRSLGSSVDTTVKNLNPETTLGDISYRSSTSNTNTRLALGTAGQVLTVNSGATAPEWKTPASASPNNSSAVVATSQSTTSTSYTDLATSGPAVTVTTGTKALVILSAKVNGNASGDTAFMSFAVSGATTISAADTIALGSNDTSSARPYQSSFATRVTLTAGSNTFTAKYRAATNATFANREIIVIDLGS